MWEIRKPRFWNPSKGCHTSPHNTSTYNHNILREVNLILIIILKVILIKKIDICLFSFLFLTLKVKRELLKLFLSSFLTNSISQHRKKNIYIYVTLFLRYRFLLSATKTRISVMNMLRKMNILHYSFSPSSLGRTVIISLNVATKAITFFKLFFSLSLLSWCHQLNTTTKKYKI